MNQNQAEHPAEMEASQPIPDSIGSLDQVSFARKVLSLQSAVKGKKVIISGACDSSFTVEAWEHERKIRAHQQLKLARKLRSTMENSVEAAKKVESPNDAKAIFLERREDMLELASLTSAVLGGYSLNSYRDYIEREEAKEEKEKQTFEKAQEHLNELRQRMFWEKSPQAFLKEFNRNRRRSASSATVNRNGAVSSRAKVKGKKVSHNVLEAKGEKKKVSDQSIHKQNQFKAPSMKKISPDKKSEKKQKPMNTHSSTIRTTTTKAPPSKKNDAHVHKKSNTGSLATSTQRSSSSSVKTTSPSPSVSPKAKNNALSQRSKTKPSRSMAPKPQVTTSKAASASNNNVPKKSKAKRKCHYCKDLTTDYSICKYWFINGNKCKKLFCDSCLERVKVVPSDADDWHCPSCTGKCDCSVCVKDREREELRASKRRRTARTDFSIFN